ncbi:endonuclease G-like 1, isoform CRA_b [Mus musculus]|uniref:Exo/endonuclease G n=1 Tax=Mus musculus TaxID=10090 RepID=E9PZS5_MOUSE|nr:endonuclease G-like 1, isoform CRA_b [Mus musculus]
MAAKSFASRLRDSRRFLNGFLAGAVVGAAGAGLTALQFFRRPDAESAKLARQPHGAAQCLVQNWPSNLQKKLSWNSLGFL